MDYPKEVNAALMVGLFALIGAGIVYATLAISTLLRSERYGVTKDKLAVYESGEETIGDTNVQFNLNYYLFAMLFVIFDVEAALLYPWAVAFKELGWAGFVTVLVFVVILFAGFWYALRKGALKWVY